MPPLFSSPFAISVESPGDEAGESKPRGTESTHGVLRFSIAFEEGEELLGVNAQDATAKYRGLTAEL